MGHSDVFSVQDSLATGEPGGEAGIHGANGVSVWGDPAQIVAAAQSESHATPACAEPAPGAAVAAADVPHPTEGLYNRIGQLTRTLHDAMRELGYHESLADARDNLPDARDRLAYIARLTGDAAEKVLNSVDRAREVQDEMAERAKSLQTRWAAVSKFMEGGDRATPAGASLVEDTCAFLQGVDAKAGATNTILTDIMMAQDFHDLTGQVIRDRPGRPGRQPGNSH
jgi:chemotaxis protein CheZ